MNTFLRIGFDDKFWKFESNGLILFDVDNLILKHNGYDYFKKLNLILDRKYKG